MIRLALLPWTFGLLAVAVAFEMMSVKPVPRKSAKIIPFVRRAS